MDQIKLPLLSQSIFKRLRYRHKSCQSQQSGSVNLLSQSICHTLPHYQNNLIEQINKAKLKVQTKKSPVKLEEVGCLKDAVASNKNFNRQLKLLIHRSKNPQLIAAIAQKKKSKIPQFCFEQQSASQQQIAIKKLKREIEPKWKLYTKKRTGKSFSLRDSFINLAEPPFLQNLSSEDIRLP